MQKKETQFTQRTMRTALIMKLVAIQNFCRREGEAGLDCKTNYATDQVSRQD